MYHYTDSGLDNIFLVNGYEIHETPYGRAVSIEDLDGLHDAIGRSLVEKNNALTGKELRFLRHELDLSQKRLGQFFGVSDQTVARAEKRKRKIDPLMDRMIRALYRECKQGSSAILDLVKGLAEADHKEAESINLEKTTDSWRVQLCDAA
jgi:putative transcriptional regulator